MQQANVVKFPIQREETDVRVRDPLNAGKKGSVVSRGGKLWVDFYYLEKRIREPSGLDDVPANRLLLRRQLDLVVAEIENCVFEFAKRFPHSRSKDRFTQLEGKALRKGPEDVIFGDYARTWWMEMEGGMSQSQRRDYDSILRNHHLPYFGDRHFSEFWSRVRMKKFTAHLKSKTNGRSRPLSAKRIHNVMIPLRVIVGDAIDEYGWTDLADPFAGLRLPKITKTRVRPFSTEEWATLMEFMHFWYRPYFTFAVQTGLRPSEQVALKWEAIDSAFIHVELSRVRNHEKRDLKTPESTRKIEIRPSMRDVLETQRDLTAHFESPYVFVNVEGRPVIQNVVREIWVRAMEKSGLPFRRMYDTRHTFASWALAAGETPEWVARTLGHTNTSMVFRTYGRYIPNLTRHDGSALEALLAGTTKKDNLGIDTILDTTQVVYEVTD